MKQQQSVSVSGLEYIGTGCLLAAFKYGTSGYCTFARSSDPEVIAYWLPGPTLRPLLRFALLLIWGIV